MKKSKKLTPLKVQSFVTTMNKSERETINGGVLISGHPILCNPSRATGCTGQSENNNCNSLPPQCIRTQEPATVCCV